MKRVTVLVMLGLTGCAGHQLAQCGGQSHPMVFGKHVAVFDDGQSTFIRIPGTARLPAVYIVGPDGKEQVVNFTTFMQDGDHVIDIPQTAHEIHLRDGDAIACLTNNAYSPDGKSLDTGTTSPNVRRVLKDAP